MIKNLKPKLPNAGLIKIGRKGKSITSKKGTEFRQPDKLDHFLITKTLRGDDDNFALDHMLMDEIRKSQGLGEGAPIREIPIRLHSDKIEDVLHTEFACYVGQKLHCSGDGENAVRLPIARTGEYTGERLTRSCPCEYLKRDPKLGPTCKYKGVLTVSIAMPNASLAGSAYVYRTSSEISVKNLMGSLTQIQAAFGTFYALPLVLVVSPVVVRPDGVKKTVYCVHIEVRAIDMNAVYQHALQAAQARRELSANSGYTALMEAERQPSPDVQRDIAEEFYPDSFEDDEAIETAAEDLPPVEEEAPMEADNPLRKELSRVYGGVVRQLGIAGQGNADERQEFWRNVCMKSFNEVVPYPDLTESDAAILIETLKRHTIENA